MSMQNAIFKNHVVDKIFNFHDEFLTTNYNE